MELKAMFLDTRAIKATVGLFVGYNLIRFAIGLYQARSRMLKLRAQGLPMPPYNPILGHLAFAAKITSKIPGDAHPSYLPDLIRRELPDLGPVFYLDTWPFGPQILAANSLEVLRQVTQDHPLEKYHALRTFIEPIADGKDIVTMQGATWKKWRTIFNPGFSMANLLTLTSGIVEETAVFCESLEKLSQSGKVFKMKPLTDYLTLDIIGNIVLDVRLHSQTKRNPLADGLRSQIKWLQFGGDVNPLERFNPIRPLILWYNKRRMDTFIGPYLDRLLTQDDLRDKNIIKLASQAHSSSNKSQTGPEQIDPEFRSFALSQVKLFLFSGHDTTSSSVCYLFYILATKPDVRKLVRAEHDEVLGTNAAQSGEVIQNDPSILNRLPYTTAVIKEMLRLYPAVSSTRAGEPNFNLIDDQGHKFPTDGFMVWANPHTIHRDPSVWPKADEFIPERFLVSADDPLHPVKGAWRPFEHGPRNCVGQELAMMEMKIILAMTARSYNIETAYDTIDGKSANNTSKQVYGERGYQIQRSQPSGDLPCRVTRNKAT